MTFHSNTLLVLLGTIAPQRILPKFHVATWFQMAQRSRLWKLVAASLDQFACAVTNQHSSHTIPNQATRRAQSIPVGDTQGRHKSSWSPS